MSHLNLIDIQFLWVAYIIEDFHLAPQFTSLLTHILQWVNWALKTCYANFLICIGNLSYCLDALHLHWPYKVKMLLDVVHIVWKLLKMSHLSFWILAFSINICPSKTDLSGNTVWPEASGFQKIVKMDYFWHFK